MNRRRRNAGKQSWKLAALVVSIFSLFGSHFGLALAQSRSETLQAISKSKGNEREAKLREDARKEGNLIWYSSTTAEDSLALNRKFQELYPFVKVQHLRAPSEKVVEHFDRYVTQFKDLLQTPIINRPSASGYRNVTLQRAQNADANMTGNRPKL
jgi:hypothetical protein